MNILTNTKVFVIIGLGVMVGGLLVASVLGASGIDQGRTDVPTEVPADSEDDESTPEPTATPPIPQYGQAEDVIDEEANDYSATITTEKGTIELDLFEQVAPNTVNSFVFLAGEGFFDSLTFHRSSPTRRPGWRSLQLRRPRGGLR
ncbi:MAG: peptidylprolyl isomerase [Dehalococcoidia bacterium]|nr:peptidylprolyl isomerase [Dehalococcoidia bacterium]